MDLIREMVHVIEKDRPKSFKLLIPKASKLRHLYQLASSESFVNDETAAEILYKAGSGDKRYMMLKGNLINKLSELILISEHSDLNKRNFIAIKFDSERQLTIARKLLYINVYHNAERITKRVWRQAQKYYLHDIELACCEILRKINYLKGYGDKVEKYQQLVEQKMKELNILEQARGMAQLALSQIKFVRSQHPDLVKGCLAYLDKLHQLEMDSPFFTLNVLRVQLILFHLQNDLENWQKTLEKIDAIFKEYDFLETEHTMLEINISRVKLYLALQDHALVKKQIKQLMITTSFEAFNRFEVLAERFQWFLHREKFQKGAVVLTEVIGKPRYQKLDSMDQASWKIRIAYLYVINEIYDLKIPDIRFDATNLHDFYQDCSALRKDKLGYHLQFVIVRLMLLILKGDIDYSNETNYLKVYYQRYLKGVCLPRTRVFYKALIGAMKDGMKKGSFLDQQAWLLSELENHQYLEYNEIIQYDKLFSLFGMLTHAEPKPTAQQSLDFSEE